MPRGALLYGCMGLGGGWDGSPPGPADLATAHRAVDAALEAGIAEFDLADIYRHGTSEEVLGRVLAERPGLRERISLQTKCGIRLPDGGAPGRYDASARWVERSVEGSLRRLGTERIDTLLIHRPDPLTPAEETVGAFVRLRGAGKVGRLGVSNMSAAQMRAFEAALGGPLAANQLELGLHRLDWLEAEVLVNHPEGSDTSFPHGTLRHCAEAGTRLQAWGALGQGRFTRPGAADAAAADGGPAQGGSSGARTRRGPAPAGPAVDPGTEGGTPLGAAVDRAAADRAAADRATAALVARLAADYGAAPEAVVLGWLMRHPAGISPVVGSTRPERIAACAQAPAVADRMDGDDWYALWAAARGRPLP